MFEGGAGVCEQISDEGLGGSVEADMREDSEDEVSIHRVEGFSEVDECEG